MPNIHLTDAQVFYLNDLLDDVVAGHIGGDTSRNFDLTSQGVDELSEKFWAIVDRGDPPDKHCPVCRAVITSPNPRKITCSDACRQAHRRNMQKITAAAKAQIKAEAARA